MTREEFAELLLRYAIAQRNVMISISTGESAERQDQLVLKAHSIHAALLATYDALAAEVRLVREHNAELEAQRDRWRNLVNDLEHNDIYLDSKAYYEGRIAELESAIALSISDIDLSRADSARDRLFEVVKPDKTEES